MKTKKKKNQFNSVAYNENTIMNYESVLKLAYEVTQ